jgi:hypothetical protein
MILFLVFTLITLCHMQVGRAPFLVSEACNVGEISCPGTNQCCGQGEACCVGAKDLNGTVDIFHSCCPFGEDAVCCDDGTCCPFRYTCDQDSCVDPTGVLIPKQSTKVSF